MPVQTKQVGDSQFEIWPPYKRPRHNQGLHSCPQFPKLLQGYPAAGGALPLPTPNQKKTASQRTSDGSREEPARCSRYELRRWEVEDGAEPQEGTPGGCLGGGVYLDLHSHRSGTPGPAARGPVRVQAVWPGHFSRRPREPRLPASPGLRRPAVPLRSEPSLLSSRGQAHATSGLLRRPPGVEPENCLLSRDGFPTALSRPPAPLGFRSDTTSALAPFQLPEPGRWGVHLSVLRERTLKYDNRLRVETRALESRYFVSPIYSRFYLNNAWPAPPTKHPGPWAQIW